MIDFRYHLVSIVSIFLALAVGIVLGAGPLQSELGSTLAGEVSGLRDEKDRLNEEVDRARSGTEARDAFIGATNPQVLDDVLSARSVALVVLPGADAEVTEGVESTLRESGARVVSTIAVGEDWVSTDPSVSSAREDAVAAVAEAADLDLTETGPVAARDVLLAALVTRAAPGAVPDVSTEQAAAGLRALADAGLVDTDVADFEQAEMVVVAGGLVRAETPEEQDAASKRWVDLTVTLDTTSQGTVVAGSLAPGEEEAIALVSAVRNDATGVAVVSTVDDSGDPMGRASVVHALVEQAAGGVGQYGLQADAEAPFAPLPAP